jgi:hypothetical protein
LRRGRNSGESWGTWGSWASPPAANTEVTSYAVFLNRSYFRFNNYLLKVNELVRMSFLKNILKVICVTTVYIWAVCRNLCG